MYLFANSYHMLKESRKSCLNNFFRLFVLSCLCKQILFSFVLAFSIFIKRTKIFVFCSSFIRTIIFCWQKKNCPRQKNIVLWQKKIVQGKKKLSKAKKNCPRQKKIVHQNFAQKLLIHQEI